MSRQSMRLLLVFLTAAVAAGCVHTPAERRVAPGTVYSNGLVVSASQLASDVGRNVLREGGNAIDAAVATAFALAVTHPAAGNIGGGGFIVAALPDGSATTFDFRETAPAAATDDMFLDEQGEYDPERHHWSALAVGVPGSVAGLFLAHQRLGVLDWELIVEPAEQLARDGFVVSAPLAESLASVLDSMRKYPDSLAQFSKSGWESGAPLVAGDRLVQSDLAATLARIRTHGARGFYEGRTADLLVAAMERWGGLITHDDLKHYRAVERPAVHSSYRALEVIGMGPPSSGGTLVAQALNILDGYGRHRCPHYHERTPTDLHQLVESMRRAFADRARHLGDSDWVDVPLERLVSKEYAAELRRTIGERASVSSPTNFTWPAEGTETTHLSVVDKDRMAVSLTTTLEQSYGSRIVVSGAGFLLNNEMGDFNPRAGLTTRKGLIGTPANLVAPRKRMLSSMSPTILRQGKLPFLVIGSPGGRTIPNTVLQVVLGVVDRGLSVQEAIDAPRLHHQWLPDRILAEKDALTAAERTALEARGHRIEERSGHQGAAMGIGVHGAPGKTWLEAGVDPRRQGAGATGY